MQYALGNRGMRGPWEKGGSGSGGRRQERPASESSRHLVHSIGLWVGRLARMSGGAKVRQTVECEKKWGRDKERMGGAFLGRRGIDKKGGGGKTEKGGNFTCLCCHARLGRGIGRGRSRAWRSRRPARHRRTSGPGCVAWRLRARRRGGSGAIRVYSRIWLGSRRGRVRVGRVLKMLDVACDRGEMI